VNFFPPVSRSSAAGDDLIFLLRAGASHAERAIVPAFTALRYAPCCLVGRRCVHPQHELIERQHRDRCQVFPVERRAGCQRSGEEIRQRDDQLVRVAAARFEVEKSFRAGAAGLVDDHERAAHQVVLGDDPLE
jgi:hypothetical protein